MTRKSNNALAYFNLLVAVHGFLGDVFRVLEGENNKIEVLEG